MRPPLSIDAFIDHHSSNAAASKAGSGKVNMMPNTENPQRLYDLHDAAADEAYVWRRLQELLAEQRDELLSAAPDRLAAVGAFESVMTELCVREKTATGTVLRIREKLGWRPSRRLALATRP